MEKYALAWTPSTSPLSLIASQQVLAVVNGAAEVALTPAGATAPDLSAGLATAEYDFPTDASVSFVVVTIGADGSVVRSDSFAFTASDHEAVTPASGLSATWVSHSAGNG